MTATMVQETPFTSSVTEPVRVMVTGSRTWRNVNQIHETLEALAGLFPNLDDWVVVHGDCPEGVDAMVNEWADDRGVKTEKHPAQWRGEDGRYNATAGFERNTEMVELQANVCLAFIRVCEKRNCRKPGRHGTHGSADAAYKARHAGIPVWTLKEGWS